MVCHGHGQSHMLQNNAGIVVPQGKSAPVSISYSTSGTSPVCDTGSRPLCGAMVCIRSTGRQRELPLVPAKWGQHLCGLVTQWPPHLPPTHTTNHHVSTFPHAEMCHWGVFHAHMTKIIGLLCYICGLNVCEWVTFDNYIERQRKPWCCLCCHLSTYTPLGQHKTHYLLCTGPICHSGKTMYNSSKLLFLLHKTHIPLMNSYILQMFYNTAWRLL